MTDRPQTCPQGHAIEWAGHWTGWCECAVWFWDDADNVLKPNMSPRERSILAALRQARADLEALEAAEKRIAELEAALKSNEFPCPVDGCGKAVVVEVEQMFDDCGGYTHSEVSIQCPNCTHEDDLNDDCSNYWGLTAQLSERRRLLNILEARQ
ncbi:MAG: hypothetical protein KGL39_05715 [Patescibacteria group bacterium]|nr:hypothetical protein [Patescibacteria group bacterium]